MNVKPITLALAFSVGMTCLSASTAQARNESQHDLGGFLAVLLGIGAIIALDDALSDDDAATSIDQQASTGHRERGHRRHFTHREDRDIRRVVPSFCLRESRWDNGPRRFYSRRCLSNNMRTSYRLPDHCIRTVQTHRGRRNVYGARCLHRNGWISG